MKDIIFLGTSKEGLRSFPDTARHNAGIELFQVQLGL
jgi:phage-related protein